MSDHCVTVDELLLEIADYKNNGQEVAVQKLKRLCSQSHEAYYYLQDRVHEPWPGNVHDGTYATCCYTSGCTCVRFTSTGGGIRKHKRFTRIKRE